MCRLLGEPVATTRGSIADLRLEMKRMLVFWTINGIHQQSRLWSSPHYGGTEEAKKSLVLALPPFVSRQSGEPSRSARARYLQRFQSSSGRLVAQK